MPNYLPKRKLEIVEHYLHNGDSMRKTAKRFGINYRTLFDWVKRYHKHGRQGLFSTMGGKNGRLMRELELKIAMLKENDPPLSIRKAKAMLGKSGIAISIKGIHRIWKRYNLVKRPKDDPYSPYGSLRPDNAGRIEYVRLLLQKREDRAAQKDASHVLNDMPSFPVGNEDILQKLPLDFLSPRRRLDWIYAQYGRISSRKYLRMIRGIRQSLEAAGLYYSSIIAALLEVYVGQSFSLAKKELQLIAMIQARKGRLYDPGINFLMAFWSAVFNAHQLRVEETYRQARKCQRLLRSLPSLHFIESCSNLMTITTDYKKAAYYNQMALSKATEDTDRKRIAVKIALTHVIAGKYKQALNVLSRAGLKSRDAAGGIHKFIRMCLSFIACDVDKSISFLEGLLEISKRDQIKRLISVVSIHLAAISSVMGKAKETHVLLRKYIPVLTRYGLEMETRILKFLLGECEIEKELIKFPIYRLLYLLSLARKTMKKGDYRRMINYARKEELLGFLHRHIVFFPELVSKNIARGEKTGLPRSILRYPVFNKEAPIYYLKFMGNVVLYRNQEYLNAKFTPREEAMLIYLAHHAGEPGRTVPLNEIYRNYWSASKDPSNRFSHILTQIKQKMNLPQHLIGISSSGGEKKLINRGFYISSDYNDFRIRLVEARTLVKAGEWQLAEEKYFRAFTLVRGAPFEKMYDEWSEHMRGMLLSRIENEVVDFVELCLKPRNRPLPKKVLARIARFIPFPDKINKIIVGSH